MPFGEQEAAGVCPKCKASKTSCTDTRGPHRKRVCKCGASWWTLEVVIEGTVSMGQRKHGRRTKASSGITEC